MSDHRQKIRSWIETPGEDEDVNFEKIARREHIPLPVSTGRYGARASKETDGSRRVRRSISQKLGGIHRRRNKKIN